MSKFRKIVGAGARWGGLYSDPPDTLLVAHEHHLAIGPSGLRPQKPR